MIRIYLRRTHEIYVSVTTLLQPRIFCRIINSNLSTESMRKSTQLMKSSKFKEFPFQYHQEINITIIDINSMGNGVGKYILSDGSLWTIFVPMVLPGELCTVRVFKNYSSYSEADLGMVMYVYV